MNALISGRVLAGIGGMGGSIMCLTSSRWSDSVARCEYGDYDLHRPYHVSVGATAVHGLGSASFLDRLSVSQTIDPAVLG